MIRYATRNNAFVPARTYALAGDQLLVEMTGYAANVIPLREIGEVNLAFAPTRAEQDRYRCTLHTTKQKIVFFNRTYRGVYDFPQTNPEYVAFVNALHAALVQHQPACRFVAGLGAAGYVANIIILALSLLVLIGLAIVLFTIGLGWLIVVKALLIALYTPTALQWAKKNRPRAYDPRAIPVEVLPSVAVSMSDAESDSSAPPPQLPR